MFLLTTRLAAWLRLARREERWKTAEILLLRHQLAVLQRRQPRRPRLDWADRALLATLLAVMPKGRRHGLRLLVTPDISLLWHCDIVRAAGPPGPYTARPAARPPARTSGPWSCGWPARTRAAAIAELTGTGRAWGTSLGVGGIRDPEEGRHRSRAAADRSYLGTPYAVLVPFYDIRHMDYAGHNSDSPTPGARHGSASQVVLGQPHNRRRAAAGLVRAASNRIGSASRTYRRRSPRHGDGQQPKPGHIRLLRGVESDNHRSEGRKHLSTSQYSSCQRVLAGPDRLVSHLILKSADK
jgi:hypothetical protein